MLTTEEYNDKPTGSNDGRTTQMTDEYLIAMLRNNVGVSEAACRAAKAAADRIEQLIAEKDAATAAAYEVAVSWLIDAGIAGDGKDDPLASSIRALAKHRETFCLASVGSEAEFHAYLSGFDAAVAIATSQTPDPVVKSGCCQPEQMYLICKHGGYYRPNCQGYTSSIAEAGRYTLAEAISETHPNGPDGPRDGMSYILAHDLAAVPAQVKVKPLVWHDCADGTSHDDGCRYEIERDSKQYWRIIRGVTGGSSYLKHARSRDEAKSLAQADYEARILAAIEPQPDPRDAVIARLVEVLEAKTILDPNNSNSTYLDAKSRAALAAAKAVLKKRIASKL